jgi:hypothetical protein
MEMGALILAVANEIVVPEITRIIAEHAEANNGQMPSDEQVIAQLDADGELIKKLGQAYLDATRG